MPHQIDKAVVLAAIDELLKRDDVVVIRFDRPLSQVEILPENGWRQFAPGDTETVFIEVKHVLKT